MKLFGNIRKQLGNLSFFMSEKAWKVGLNHFEWRKKMRKFGLIIFYVGKSAENWTLLFLLAKKVRKVGLCHFFGGKSSES